MDAKTKRLKSAMIKNELHPPNELLAIESARFRMRLWLVLPIAVLVIGALFVPLRALIVPTIIILVVLAKGAAEYRTLGKRRDFLLDSSIL